MVRKLKELLYHRPGGVLLVILLAVISIASLQPKFTIAGWDNYSSYFSPLTNIFRTLFSTWRAHRGLGVPSDSEVVDVFRQLFNFLLRGVLPETLVDQVYILFCLSAGVLGVYVFVRRFLSPYFHRVWLVEWAAAIAGFLYLCNLNTLAVFYFPIITYVSRFAAIPLLFLTFFELHRVPRISRRHILLASFMFLFTSGSYVTATIIITTGMSLLLWALFAGKYRRSLLIFVFWGLFNAFWLLPFANYTKDKSPIIRLAPTFIEANETQLNKGKSFYDPLKQLILFPNFFDTQYTLASNNTNVPFHPLASLMKNPIDLIALYQFPVAFIVGSICILITFRRRKKLLWIPLLLTIYLLLSMKEYSPVGWLYRLFDENIPYFGVLFRFADTKFHPYIAFAGSIAAAVAFLDLVHLFREAKISWKREAITLLSLVWIGVIFIPFQWYAEGGLIGFFMYTKVPAAYHEIAQKINEDPMPSRVLHLPFDTSAYWKSYTWGMIGSSFFHYMINKPLIDKTFEPGSMENAYLDKALNVLTRDNQLILSGSNKRKRAEELYRLLQNTGTGYIVLDQTVSSSILSRGIVFGGTYNYPDAKAIIDQMVDMGLASRLLHVPVDMAAYESLYPQYSYLPQQDFTGKNPDLTPLFIDLVKLNSTRPPLSFSSSVTTVDPLYKNLLEHEPLPGETTYLQLADNSQAVTYPLRRDDGAFTRNGSVVTMTVPISPPSIDGPLKIISVADPSLLSRLVELIASRTTDGVTIQFYWQIYPTINGQVFKQLLTEYVIAEKDLTNPSNVPYRLKMNDTFLPFPLPEFGGQLSLGSVLIHGSAVDIALYGIEKEVSVDPHTFQMTDNPNCFGDAREHYTYFSTPTNEGLTMSTQNGTSCWWVDLSQYTQGVSYLEVEAKVTGDQQNLEGDEPDRLATSKEQLRSAIAALDKPSIMRWCLEMGQGGDCLNHHQLVDSTGTNTFTFALDTPVENTAGLLALVSLQPIANQLQTATITSVNLHEYKILADTVLPLPALPLPDNAVITSLASPLTLSFPIPISPYSFLASIPGDQWYVTNKSCDPLPSFRTFRMLETRLISAVENCYNEAFQTVPFDSKNFLVWMMNYHLYSGQFPKFIIRDKVSLPINSYVSLEQGYPDIAGFKEFQKPELPGISQESITKLLATAPTQSASLLIAPRPEREDTRQKQFTVHQNTENEGVVAIASFDILALPAYWRDLEIRPIQANTLYSIPQVIQQGTILPSLRYITYRSSGENSQVALYFSEAFDPLWRVFGKDVSVVSHGRCDGYANCYILQSQGAGEKTVYLFYLPEALSLLGWVITAGTVLSMVLIFRSRRLISR